ncbi:MAG TPA: hypothetical protein VGK23_09700 [Methanomassiliicoccales archaeon]|jgi:hypothetical protein
MESVLAMMVVICGVILVTTSLAFVGIDLRRDSGQNSLHDGCRSLADQVFSLGPPFFEGDVLQNSSLGSLNPSLLHAGPKINGYSILLQDITMGAASKVLVRMGELSPENETCSISVPLTLSMTDRTVHAAKATVMVWR